MEEDTEYKKLPVDERCVHKLWKARVDGYEEAAKIFRSIDDEKSPEWNKFLGLIKKFVIDSNALAQEKGLEAALAFVENCGVAGKTVGEVISGIVTKCLGAPKAKTKELGIQIALMYIEIEKHEATIEQLIAGFDQKNPKIVATCVSTVLMALREFGAKVINVKPLVKKIPALLSDRDKSVRDEAKQLTVEIFRWIGPVFKTQIQSLPQVVLTELETEFEKVKNEKAVPSRYLRSQQQKQILEAVAASNNDCEVDGDEDGDVDTGIEIDPMDLIDPVDILSKLPKDFYEKLEAKKWQERKESLEALDTLLQNPKLQTGDYGEIVRALKKVITKDTNVVLVALAGKCLAALAKGLSKKFQPYAVVCISGLLEKFKEKKANVVQALRDAIDAIYPSTNLEAIQEDVFAALTNKNPAVKAETAMFLARCFTKTIPTIFNKKLLKAYVTALLKTLNESDPGVRDASADALGTAMKLVGEKTIAPFLAEVDPLKMEKIKEYFEKAVITVKIPGVKKEPRCQSAPVKAPAKGGSTEPKPVARPATAVAHKKAPMKKATSASTGLSKSASTKNVLPIERDLSQEEVDEQAAEILPPDVISGLCDSNWKTRLSSIENFQQALGMFEAKCGHTQVLVRVLSKKPGLKDTNFQVLKLRLDAVTFIVENFGISVTSADYILNDITEKLGDPKNSTSACAALSAIAEAIRLEYVVSKVLTFAFEQKSPKVQQESLLWVSQAIKDFGFQINPKLMIDDAKKGVNSTNPTVRQATISLLGTMYLYMGNTLAMFFDSEKPALKQQIQSEFDKFAGQKPPAATRGPQANGMQKSGDGDDDDADDDSPAPTMNINDLLPRVDISSMITESLIADLSDKNWKTRNEGLIKFQAILNENKLIKSSLGSELPPILAQRLVDSNAKIAQTAVEICQQLATSMGPSCKQHVRVLFPGILRGLGDNKAYLRSACITCINTWGDQCGYKEFFDGEMFADALKNGTPALKTEVWGWMADKLPNMPPKSINKEELIACLPHLYANICDRNADVRKNANECVLGIMMHLGYDAMMKSMDKQKPASKKDIQTALDKARPNLPVKPLPKGKQQAPIVVEDKKVVKSGGSKLAKPIVSKPGSAAATNRKKEEEVDLSPMFCINNLKHQRLLDEQKLKVLKWNFTTPREEFTDLLKEQMMTANVNKSLMANMFHDDFRYHLKVIESLMEDLYEMQGLICNLDLVLKWLSLRFYDTNPSVLLKGLEYLNLVFQKLVDASYVLTDVEGTSFIPHLLTKIGDPKDAVRNGVRQLLRQICLVYPFSKVFAYLMDALKSKNARQRTECLDELGYLIETYNLSVCQPTPQHALKEIARQISDRDNSVRSAALNCIVKAHELAGEKIYKMVGQLNEKDLSMLDERIKRSKKNPKPVMEVKTSPSSVEIVNVPIEREDDSRELSGEEELPSEEEPHPGNNRMYEQMQTVVQSRAPSGPFGLKAEVIDDIEKEWTRADQIKQAQLTPLDLSFSEQAIRIRPSNGCTYPTDRLAQLLTKIPSRPQSANVTMYSASSPQHFMSPPQRPSTAPAPELMNLMETSPKLDAKLLNIIKGIGHPDRLVSHASLNELSDILESQEKQAVLRDYDEIYIQSVLDQFKHLSQRPVSEAVSLYQPLLSSLFNFFNSKTLGQNLSLVSIKNLIAVLLGLMSDHKFGAGEEYTKVINSICLKILDRCNFTHLNCALVRLLKETCSGSALPKFTELLMKCIWRNVKLMPERVNELDYEAVLMEVHDFMLALPTPWWAQRPSDTPMRTIKTIIHNMTKIKGAGILNHLNNIPKHSELNTYVLKILKKDQPVTSGDQQAYVSQSHQQRSQQDRMNRATHDQVSNIFKLISDKETSKLGLKQLYEFKEKHPEVDIQPFLKGATPYFQTYINDGLADFQRSSQNNTNNNHSNESVDHEDNQMRNQADGNPNNADYWMQKLNMYRVRGKLQNDDKESMDNKVADENLNMNQIQSRLTSMTRKDVDHIPAQRLSLLQQKLAQYKHN